MALRTKLTEKLGIRCPVLQAPMGGSAGGTLAAAVSPSPPAALTAAARVPPALPPIGACSTG